MTPNNPVSIYEVKAFLKDYQEKAEIEILETGSKEKTELLKIAKARGYNLDKNTDLAGFKCIYAFTDRPNHNGAILPEKALLKALPTIVGKPVNIGHERRFVVGHILDYAYQQQEKRVVVYGVFYKSCFDEEWEEAKKDFKAKKLNVSFEIWCPEDKKRKLPDGTFELLQQEIAGGALLFKSEPAFEDAKVLELAKKHNKPVIIHDREAHRDCLDREAPYYSTCPLRSLISSHMNDHENVCCHLNVASGESVLNSQIQ